MLASSTIGPMSINTLRSANWAVNAMSIITRSGATSGNGSRQFGQHVAAVKRRHR
jgi:hypothetical protein